MNLEQAIIHCYEVANGCNSATNTDCRADHRQLAKWLEELKELRLKNGTDEVIQHIEQKDAELVAQHTLWWLDETIMLVDCIRNIVRGRYRKPYKLITVYELMEIYRHGTKLKEMLLENLYTARDEYDKSLATNPYCWLVKHERCTNDTDIQRIKDACDYLTMLFIACDTTSVINEPFHEFVCHTMSKLNETAYMLKEIRDKVTNIIVVPSGEDIDTENAWSDKSKIININSLHKHLRKKLNDTETSN